MGRRGWRRAGSAGAQAGVSGGHRGGAAQAVQGVDDGAPERRGVQHEGHDVAALHPSDLRAWPVPLHLQNRLRRDVRVGGGGDNNGGVAAAGARVARDVRVRLQHGGEARRAHGVYAPRQARDVQLVPELARHSPDVVAVDVVLRERPEGRRAVERALAEGDGRAARREVRRHRHLVRAQATDHRGVNAAHGEPRDTYRYRAGSTTRPVNQCLHMGE
mmetsp:Transcript_7869/g.20243  ORF Transcript_7869/g.20243 Transcript_7869/m.20243 type:complete len:217 (-) Transcript_7869:1291-1941(-)